MFTMIFVRQRFCYTKTQQLPARAFSHLNNYVKYFTEYCFCTYFKKISDKQKTITYVFKPEQTE